MKIAQMKRAEGAVDRIYGISESGELVLVVCREPEHPHLWQVHSLITGDRIDRDQYSNDIIERAECGVYDQLLEQAEITDAANA